MKIENVEITYYCNIDKWEIKIADTNNDVKTVLYSSVKPKIKYDVKEEF